MQATHEALIWGISSRIDTSKLEQRTATWLERLPGHRRRTRFARTFTRLAGYEQTDSLLAVQGMDAYEDEIDGHLVMVFERQGRCVGMWYNAASTGTFCLDFPGDLEAYAMADPFWPWQD
jgi:hypothetical protein